MLQTASRTRMVQQACRADHGHGTMANHCLIVMWLFYMVPLFGSCFTPKTNNKNRPRGTSGHSVNTGAKTLHSLQGMQRQHCSLGPLSSLLHRGPPPTQGKWANSDRWMSHVSNLTRALFSWLNSRGKSNHPRDAFAGSVCPACPACWRPAQAVTQSPRCR